MTVRILEGDCRDVLRTLPDESVHCIVTSPPYFGLRDYGCDGQMGLEATPDEFVAGMVAVFRECRRVLRNDGTLWLNIGDSYSGSGPSGASYQSKTTIARTGKSKDGNFRISDRLEPRGLTYAEKKPIPAAGTKAKDLIGIPWMLAFALRADGWYLRQDIIWAKPNPMPESVTDRCTKSHEYVFLLSKSARYYFDAEAIKEPCRWDPLNTKMPDGWDTGDGAHGSFHRDGREKGRRNGGKPAGWADRDLPRDEQADTAIEHNRVSRSGNKTRRSGAERGIPGAPTDAGSSGAVAGSVPWEGSHRNKRDVWTIATAPFAEAHFATFPPALVEPCILAGCPQGGVCLDPFGGAGTTGLVADRLQRDAVLIELNHEYAQIAKNRIIGEMPLFAFVANA